MSHRLIAIAFLGLVSCGDNAHIGERLDAADATDVADATGSEDAAGFDAGDATQQFTCDASDDVSFPSVGKSCGTPSDCTILVHTIDCCGNTIAVGVNAADADGIAAFEAAETQCSSMFPTCGCPAGPSVAEDGEVGTQSMISVDCVDDLCRTFIAGLQ